MSAAGFGSVKSIALISKSATYDAFLANSSYMYVLGHATGSRTVIKTLGKVPGDYTFPGPVYFRWKDLGGPLAGE